MKYSAEEKAMWLEDSKQSGKSAWTYAKENGLNTQTFIKWTKPKVKAEQSLIEIPAKIFQPARRVQEILIEKEEVKIYIPLTICVDELSVIFKALGAVQ
jgi:transposase-like protein